MKKNCLRCGKEFKTKPCLIKIGKGKYCSTYCYHQSMIGSTSWIRVKHHTEEAKSKMSISKKLWLEAHPNSFLGKHHTQETKERDRLMHLGIVKSAETRRKLSIALKGKTPWIKGKSNIWTKGEKNRHWKGGVTSLQRQIRNSPQYFQWRTSIFNRDNYCCQKCGKKGVEFHADHYPKSLAQVISENKILTLENAFNYKELWNITGGRTLCVECHKKTPTYLKQLSKHPNIYL